MSLVDGCLRRAAEFEDLAIKQRKTGDFNGYDLSRDRAEFWLQQALRAESGDSTYA